jgi:hypothetical protein
VARNQRAFCPNKPTFNAACNMGTTEQLYREWLAHIKSQRAASRRAADIAAKEAHCKAITACSSTIAGRLPPPPGWKAEWLATQMLAGTAKACGCTGRGATSDLQANASRQRASTARLCEDAAPRGAPARHARVCSIQVPHAGTREQRMVARSLN